jgi:hypothetical protein
VTHLFVISFGGDLLKERNPVKNLWMERGAQSSQFEVLKELKIDHLNLKLKKYRILNSNQIWIHLIYIVTTLLTTLTEWITTINSGFLRGFDVEWCFVETIFGVIFEALS